MGVRNSNQFESAETVHRTVSRVAWILEEAARSSSGVRLNEIAHQLEAPRSSIHGLLKGLVAVGYLSESEGGYVNGPGVQALLSWSEYPPVVEIARIPMQTLHRKFDETVMLGMRVGRSMVYLLSLESTQVIKYSAPLNQRREIFPTSMGKIYIADMPKAECERYLAKKVRESDLRDKYMQELTEIRKTKVAFNHGETITDVLGIASGIRKRGGQLEACVSVAGPLQRMQKREHEIGDAVRDAAREVSKVLDK